MKFWLRLWKKQERCRHQILQKQQFTCLRIETMLALAEGRLQEALDLARYVIEETKKAGATGVWVAYDMVYCAAEALREMGEENHAIALN
jgi:hypothetical protein